MDDLLAAARHHRSGALVLRGEAGIGKSALLGYAAEHADGMRVLRGTGVETEMELPYAGLHRLLLPVGEYVDALTGRQRGALRAAFGDGPAVAEDRFLTSLAVLTVLAEAAEAGPVLCLVDDAHWLDGASADALVFAARRVDAEGIVLLFAARDDPSHPFPAPGLPDLALTGLDADAAGALLADRAGGPVAAAITGRLVADTLGNPLGLAEIAGSLTRAQLSGLAPLPDRLPAGGELEEVFVRRIRQLPADTQTALLVAAAHDAGELAVVLRATALLGVDGGALDAAEAARLVRADATAVSFRHPLVRSAVYRSATSGQRRAVQRALAEVFEGEPDAERRAWHLANAAVGPDDHVADALHRVAEQARARGGHAAAIAAAERAAALTADPERRAQRLVDAAESAWLAGQSGRARTLVEQARPLTGAPVLRGRIEHLRGSIETACGAPSAAYVMLVEGAAPITALDPQRAVRMLTEAGQIGWGTGDLGRIAEAGRRLAALPTTTHPAARAVLGLSSFLHGDPDTASVLLRQAADLARAAADPREALLAAMGGMFLGDEGLAIDLLTRAVVQARSDCAVATLPSLLAPLATVEAWTGRIPSAVADATEALRLATDTGQDNPAAHARSVLAWIAAMQGRTEDCAALAEAALARAIGERLGPHTAIASWALALVDLGAGRPELAADRLEALAGAGPGEGHPMVSMFAAADLVESATRAGRDVRAGAALATLREWAAYARARWARALVARCEGLLAAPDDQDRHFAEALDLHAGGGRPFDTARTELLYGETLRRRRRRAEARTRLRAANETFQRLGAAPWAEKARTELLATGETARKRDVSGTAKLTPQEMQIVRFVAEGATNRAIAAQLFLSPRTVDYHLRNVFAKLGLTSRRELIRLSLQEGG